MTEYSEGIAAFFTSYTSDVRFLTLKGSAYQKIGKVSDLIRKISKTYVVVRELNKKSEGYHFHALIKVDKEPTKRWFRKGVHMNLQKLGNPSGSKNLPTGMPMFNQNEISEIAEYDKDIALGIVKIQTLKTDWDNVNKKARYSKDIKRITSYMSKEMELPAQYEDYLAVDKGKTVKIW